MGSLPFLLAGSSQILIYLLEFVKKDIDISGQVTEQSRQAKVRKIGDRITFINPTPYATPYTKLS